ncbi:amidase [Pseudomonas cucumis]|uniref:Amidase n=1 Tax=Pseudomonas cucumis TaxID=2954082 RepID=A0ABY9F1X0_9PSED|nr:amidase [Pseudomonas cucumis]WLG86121.1 amidase [Pseudomonas cucumis]WLG91717.1 amidase [Pseudomonas cucumis]
MSRRSFIRRRPFSTLLLVLLIALLGWGWQERLALWAFPDIISAYTAKEYCSCRYVMNNPAEYCQSYVKQYLSISGFVDDAANKHVTVGGMGRSNSAAWVGERQGCRLMP